MQGLLLISRREAVLLPGFGEQVRVVACSLHEVLVYKGRNSFQEVLVMRE